MSRKASVFFILVLSFPIMRTFHNNLNWNDNINETLGEHTNKGTFIKYYKISQLIHTQSIAN